MLGFWAMKTEIQQLAEQHGLPALAAACGVSKVAVHYWVKKGHLPKTDLTGETFYAAKLHQKFDVLAFFLHDDIKKGLKKHDETAE